MNSSQEKFAGIGRLYGTHALERLAQAHVVVVGVGGVGSWTVEALARSGVGRLTLIDMDSVCVTNINRQLPALEHTVGQDKVRVLAERVATINAACRVEPVVEFFGADNASELLAGPIDYVVDAIDAIPDKIALVAACVRRGLPVVTSGGAGGRRDPSAIRVGDLASTGGDGLLRELRRGLRRELELNPKGDWGIQAVYSAERQVFPQSDGSVCTSPDGSSLRMDCASGFGAATFVTGAFGFTAAGVVVSAIAR